MQTRPLGTTGLTVTPLGLGTAALGRPAYINLAHGRDLDGAAGDRSVEAVARHAHTVMDAAYDAGVRYLDAARSYGRAEEFLAAWLHARGLGPGDVTVGSKWGYAYVGEWRVDAGVHEVKDHSPAAFDRQVAESRALLGDALDLYQIHSATLETGVLEDRAVLGRLAALRDAGPVVGLSVSGPRQGEVVRRALEAEVDGVNPFACVQATWNLLEPSAGAALADAHAAGWGVIVKEGVANGRLAGRDGEPSPGGRRLLGDVAARHGAGVDAVALAGVLAQPWADVVLSGAATVDQLRGNLAAVDVTLDPDDLAALAGLAEPAGEYWAHRATLPWN